MFSPLLAQVTILNQVEQLLPVKN